MRERLALLSSSMKQINELDLQVQRRKHSQMILVQLKLCSPIFYYHTPLLPLAKIQYICFWYIHPSKEGGG